MKAPAPFTLTSPSTLAPSTPIPSILTSQAIASLTVASLITIIAIIAFTTLTAATATAQPPTLIWSFQGNGGIECITTVPDIDGDGGPDVVFEGYGNGPSGVDHVFAIRGRSSGTGQVLWSARPVGGASSGGGDGDNCLRLGPDVNADGFPDLLLGTAWGGRTAYTLNGLTGSTIWGFDTYVRTPPSPPSSGWVYAMDNLGTDVTGDGVPEILFCCGSFNDHCYCVNGATGALVWAYYGQDAFFDVRSCQDINNDGIRDVVACLGDNAVQQQVIALSGATGTRLWSSPTIGNALWNLAFIDDITGDGIREIVPSTWRATLYCLNGASGAVAWSVPTSAQQRVAALDDVNGDGVKDIAVGFNTTSACRVFSGANGAVLWNYPTSDWTWALDRIDDSTGDGINDVVVGDFDGKVYLLDGVTGNLVWNWTNPTADKIMTIRGVPDLSGNGTPDVVAGTQLLASPQTGGDVYALEGREGSTSVPDVEDSPALALSAALPNPFRERTTLHLTPGRSGQLEVLLYGTDGRVVRQLVSRFAGAGESLALSWDGRAESGIEMPAGVYFLRAVLAGTDVAQRRIVLVR
jgi:outer membrane protein assembly factor BamB